MSNISKACSSKLCIQSCLCLLRRTLRPHHQAQTVAHLRSPTCVCSGAPFVPSTKHKPLHAHKHTCADTQEHKGTRQHAPYKTARTLTHVCRYTRAQGHAAARPLQYCTHINTRAETQKHKGTRQHAPYKTARTCRLCM